MSATRTPFARLGLMAAMAASLSIAAAPAFAQQPATPRPAAPAPAAPAPAAPGAPGAPAAAAPTGPIKVDLQPSQEEWTKICGKDKGANKEICYTTRDFGQDPNEPPVLALAVYDVKGEDERIVRLLLPVALLLQKGFRFYIDKGQPEQGQFAICFPNGCFAEAKVKGTTIAALKKATTLSIQVRNQVDNEVTFTLPMKDFAKAFDGAPMDPAELERRQKELQDQLQKRSEEMRQQLEKSAGAPPATPAPAAPAAPAPAAPAPAAPAAPKP
ncbi:MAG: invasion associated locus B family protein [Rhizobiales bacterium]|nr:invasion associated locus B family protein [Hyphomicrobiales bacterium]